MKIFLNLYLAICRTFQDFNKEICDVYANIFPHIFNRSSVTELLCRWGDYEKFKSGKSFS
ncbi:CLUMA_CG008539, isoform A [Clunio marinus]|uniref:CLUMA_CG008539, isoform A n=1 Tax=Clunio marinus TaxID=568069 RepID=A0A1J1I423_9DIPT|nr:CLUMA_CG008539, isoform A [Clunio marinus]